MPRIHRLTDLLICHFHERVEHQGRGMTTNEIRGKTFRIFCCNSAVLKIIYECITCRRLQGRTKVEQNDIDLLAER